MKRIKLVIREPSIKELAGRELNLLLDDRANLIDAITEVDKIINSKGVFPVPGYGSFLHMIYNPVKNRFYEQVVITIVIKPGQLLNVRENPKKTLPGGIKVYLTPMGGCCFNQEEVIDYSEFLKALERYKV